MITWLAGQFDRLSRRFHLKAHHRPPGRLTAIFVAEATGAPMHACEQTLALVDQGLSDDRYALGRGFWRLTDGRQVTLILAEDLHRAERRHGLALDAGRHRRNLVVSGLVGVDLRARQLRIGEALVTWHRVRPPCGYLDRVSGKGMGQSARAFRRALPARARRRADPGRR